MTKQTIRDKIRRWTDKLVTFETYRRSGKEDDARFVEELNKAMHWIENWADQRDVNVNNWRDRVIELTVGNGQPQTGIVAHLDVVPPGDEEWASDDPFEVMYREEDERTLMLGRGVVDDKGPVASLLTVLERLGNQMDPWVGSVRLILDTAEEIGFDNIREYAELNTDRLPDQTMVMDGYFPLVAGEKGLAWFEMNIDITDHQVFNQGHWRLESLDVGETYNQVPDAGKAILKHGGNPPQSMVEITKDLPGSQRDRLHVDCEGNRAIIESKGQTAHGSAPQQGRNALVPLISLFERLNWADNPSAEIGTLLQSMLNSDAQMDTTGRWLGLEATDERFQTGSTVNPGIIQYNGDGGRLTIGLDARLMPGQLLEQAVEDARSSVDSRLSSETNVTVEIINMEEPLIVDLDKSLPAAALRSYRDVTGNNEAVPVYMGGRTDATVIPNSFAFGVMKHSKAPFYNFHGTNEQLYLDELVDASTIYYETLVEAHQP